MNSCVVVVLAVFVETAPKLDDGPGVKAIVVDENDRRHVIAQKTMAKTIEGTVDFMILFLDREYNNASLKN
eukprot:CAMPEP_0113507506 /NCGR_PEP_ID=MMETSP0014_2-20120614/36502_1 /TAXON_ID=2857 /ORGANISM="Nitzschia sp." /LENGTH=70 /DNA_ID=CAMNT_0000403121 /DNA_START=705 /DNA_END=917 /DNA_ORIENTATION=- /assembly_acc=CAM_ASM_000159